eukprot:GFKZ01002152.1.p5 GENE.GFKZ01002152.1~~GFKZ01002152.1.p5  ORF type:complete len:103 (+),score=8.55 GFKZ01002152.1:628-936(+)
MVVARSSISLFHSAKRSGVVSSTSRMPRWRRSITEYIALEVELILDGCAVRKEEAGASRWAWRRIRAETPSQSVRRTELTSPTRLLACTESPNSDTMRDIDE